MCVCVRVCVCVCRCVCVCVCVCRCECVLVKVRRLVCRRDTALQPARVLHRQSNVHTSKVLKDGGDKLTAKGNIKDA